MKISTFLHILFPLIVPLNFVPYKFRVNVEVEPTVIFPSISIFFKVTTALPPFLPEFPHSPLSIFMKILDPNFSIELVNLIFVTVLVI